jgi:hypothetical protein
MKYTKPKKILAMFLTCAVFIGTIGTGAISNTPAVADMPNAIADEIIPETSMRMSEIPEAISLDAIRENNHVARLYELESDLHSVVFRNADGTNTMYMWGTPVQFIAEDGTFRDKSNQLHNVASTDSHSRAYAYVNRDNDIRTYFPHTLDREIGILLTDGNYSIERSPISANTARVANRSRSFDNNWVYYDGIFGRHTALRYTPTFEGFKEEVVLERNVSINRSSFIVRTNGLKLVYNNGSYSLVDPTTREVVGGIGEIIAYESSRNDMVRFDSSYRHFYETAVVRENEEYCVTIVVDERFLSNAVYPVYVDPTTMLNSWNDSGSLKQARDATVVQSNSTHYGFESWLNAGRRSNGAARTLIQFPGLETNPTLRHIPASQITSAPLLLNTNTSISPLWFLGLKRIGLLRRIGTKATSTEEAAPMV